MNISLTICSSKSQSASFACFVKEPLAAEVVEAESPASSPNVDDAASSPLFTVFMYSLAEAKSSPLNLIMLSVFITPTPLVVVVIDAESTFPVVESKRYSGYTKLYFKKLSYLLSYLIN